MGIRTTVALFAVVIVGGCVQPSVDGRATTENLFTILEDDFSTAPPWAEGAEIGRSYDYVLSIHCGVGTTLIDGRSFYTDTIKSSTGPTPEWLEHGYRGGDSVIGTVTLTNRDTAVFEGGPEPITFTADPPPGYIPQLCK